VRCDGMESIQERLERIKERLQAYYDAELAILQGQEYRIGTRTLRRADLVQVQKNINELEQQKNILEARLSGSFMGSKRVVLRDI